MVSKYSDSPSISSRSVFPIFRLRGKGNLSRKSQIASQIFIYIIAIFVFSVILLYGYKAIKEFRDRSEQIAFIKFRTDLISTVKRVSPDFGTIEKKEFFIGGEYDKVCFVQTYKPNKNDILNKIGNVGDMVVWDSVNSDVNKNVFLFATKLQESFDVGKINPTGRYLCIDTINGKVKIQFEGKGDHAYISRWG